MAKMMLGYLAQRQAGLLITTGKYTAAVKADVANGFFWNQRRRGQRRRRWLP